MTSPAPSAQPVPPALALKRALDRALGLALVVLMGASVINVLWQVTTRFVLSSPSTFTDELARFLLIWVGLLGAAYAAGQRMHLAIDLLPSKLSGARGEALGLVIEAVTALFALAVMVGGGLQLVALTLRMGQTSASLGLPLAVVYSVLPLAGGLIAAYAALFAYDHARALGGRPLLFRETDAPSAETFGERPGRPDVPVEPGPAAEATPRR